MKIPCTITTESLCCAAPVSVKGRVTHYYVCEKCGRPCDAITRSHSNSAENPTGEKYFAEKVDVG